MAKTTKKSAKSKVVQAEEIKKEEEVINHVVTENDLENNPELKDNGLESGDEIQIKEKKILTLEETEKILNEGGFLSSDDFLGVLFKNIKTGTLYSHTIDGISEFKSSLNNPYSVDVEFIPEEYRKEIEDFLNINSQHPKENDLEVDSNDIKLKEVKEKEAIGNAVLYSKTKSESFIKLENQLSLEQLKQKSNLPANAELFVFENGDVFSLSADGFINKDGKQILNNYL